LAKVVQNLTAERFHLTGFSVGVVGRVGVSTASPGTVTATDLLARAERALGEPMPPVGFA
jgi:hypothetical protein